ncbi:MAG TPA: YihY/virulence factor BrkB family protein [Kineosporiaceae bacterium]|nr:YihY/virulence factor BrkB family protein [Kineosporiaceae bacterium]
MGLLARVQAVPGWVDGRLQPLRRTLPWRAYARYSAARGNVLAGGVAYFAFFSLFPAMALGFTAFGLLLGGQEDLQVRLVQYVNSNLGSAVITYRAAGGGIVSVEQLTAPGVLTAAGLLGLVTLVMSGLGWIAALRDGVQAVFAGRQDTNFVLLKVVDLVVLLAAGLAVLVSVVLSVVVGVATDQVLAALGIPGGSVSSWALSLSGQLVLTAVDALVFTLLFHRMAGVPVPLRDAATGGLVASVGFTVLKLSGSLLLQAATRNRFLAAFGVVIGLLFWMNLVARVTLVGAAWSATVATDRGHLGDASPGPAPVTVPVVPAADEARRAARTLLAAGFVAGAAVVSGLRTVSGARRRSRRGRGPDPC